MTQPTKPSAGALMAASVINHGSAEGIHEMAEIIDRETGMAELLGAAKWDCDKLWAARQLAEATGNLEFAKLFNDRKLATEQAIAKCESGSGSE